GKVISEKVAQLLSAIREKFQTAGTEGLLTRAQENPIERNTSKFQDELETQMQEDEAFANRLQELMTQLKSNETINQIVLKGVEVKGKAKVGDINLAATRDGSVNQEAVVDSQFGDDLDLGNVNIKA
ncbi:MAG: Fis family transcriptional regulator, partial [Nostoc sp.]